MMQEELERSNNLLRELLSRTTDISEEEANQRQDEIDDIDESIEKYKKEIEDLKTKISNKDNYKVPKKDEITSFDLLQDAFTIEENEINSNKKNYQKALDKQNKFLKIYNDEASKLREEIKEIESRINKSDLAKKNGIAKRLCLSDEEVSALKAQIKYKTDLLNMGNEVIIICNTEINKYEGLLKSCEKELEKIHSKSDKLQSIISNHQDLEHDDIDTYKMRLDKDNLFKLQSALRALENRKSYLLYNPKEELEKQIKKNDEVLDSLQKSANSSDNTKTQTTEDNSSIDSTNDKGGSNKGFVILNKDSSFEHDTSHIFGSEEDVQEKRKSDSTSLVSTDGGKLIEIIDAPISLKNQKFSQKFKEAWKKWGKKALAAAMAIGVIVPSAAAISKNSSKDKDDDFQPDIKMENRFNPWDTLSYKPTDKEKVEERKSLEEVAPSNESILDNNVSSDLEMVSNVTSEDLYNKPIDSYKDSSYELNDSSNINTSSLVVGEDLTAKTSSVSSNNSLNFENNNLNFENDNFSDNVKPEIEATKSEDFTYDEWDETILTSPDDYITIPLDNGKQLFVDYGDGPFEIEKLNKLLYEIYGDNSDYIKVKYDNNKMIVSISKKVMKNNSKSL